MKITNKNVLECIEALNSFEFKDFAPVKFLNWKFRTLKVLESTKEDFLKSIDVSDEFKELNSKRIDERSSILQEYCVKNKDNEILSDKNGNFTIDSEKISEYKEAESKHLKKYIETEKEFNRIRMEENELLSTSIELNIDLYNLEEIESKEILENSKIGPFFEYLIK